MHASASAFIAASNGCACLQDFEGRALLVLRDASGVCPAANKGVALGGADLNRGQHQLQHCSCMRIRFHILSTWCSIVLKYITGPTCRGRVVQGTEEVRHCIGPL